MSCHHKQSRRVIPHNQVLGSEKTGSYFQNCCLLRQHFKWPWIFADGEMLKKNVSFQSWTIRGKLFTVTQVTSDSFLKGWAGINTKPLADKDSSIHAQSSRNSSFSPEHQVTFPMADSPSSPAYSCCVGLSFKVYGQRKPLQMLSPWAPQAPLWNPCLYVRLFSSWTMGCS